MSSRLPNECYQQIFSNLVHDNNTLFSIIQVNHTWCKNGIIYLWKNPFGRRIELNSHKKIISTFLNENTLFDYPCFITHLDFDNLFRIVSKCLENNKDDDVEYCLNFLMQRPDLFPSIFSDLEYYVPLGFKQTWFIILLILVIMTKGRVNLQWFKFDIMYKDIQRFLGDEGEQYYYIDDERIVGSNIEMRYNMVNKIESVITIFLKLDESKEFFENLENLKLGHSSFKILLEAFSTCKNLKTIEIEHSYFQLILEPLISLIKNQNHLENIIINGARGTFLSNYDEAIFEIISSLNTVAHTLRRIEIWGIRMINGETLSFIGKCENLEILSFVNNHSYISIKNFEWIALAAELPKLTYLELMHISSDTEYVNQFNPFQMILQNKMIASNLETLHLENMHIKNHDLLKLIGENCRRLIDFMTQLTADDDIQYLFTILENNPNIKKFQLLNVGYPMNFDMGFIIKLAKALSGKTNYVRFNSIIRCIDEYRVFLENCEMKKLFVIVPNNNENNLDEFEECVKKWSEEKGRKIKKLQTFIFSVQKQIFVEWE